ncbi:MAG TPA: hypothetical protein VFF88_02325, partial [Methylocella sp.]|nr:hypothetical protein [Methylocella sp.]
MSSKKPKPADWISLIEAGYSLEGSEQQWLDNLRSHADVLLEDSAAKWAFVAHYTPTTCRLGVTRFPKIMGPFGHLFHAALDEQAIDLIYRQGRIVDTASNVFSARHPYAMQVLEKMAGSLIGRTPDIFQVGCDTGTGECLGLAVLLRERRAPAALERKRWPQAAAHIGAGLRLRSKLRNLSPDALPIEAVLDSGGRMHDGQGPAIHKDTRENLRDTVLRIDRSRT